MEEGVALILKNRLEFYEWTIDNLQKELTEIKKPKGKNNG